MKKEKKWKISKIEIINYIFIIRIDLIIIDGIETKYSINTVTPENDVYLYIEPIIVLIIYQNFSDL